MLAEPGQREVQLIPTRLAIVAPVTTGVLVPCARGR